MNHSTIILGTWSWGTGQVGGDQIFGNNTDFNTLEPVFETAKKQKLMNWDTATVYGMGASEDLLGRFAQTVPRQEISLSTKFTPQIAEMYDHKVEKMAEASMRRLHTDYLDMYWIHNPMDVQRWTPGLIPLLKEGKVKQVGVSNHNIEEIEEANRILAKEGFQISAVQNHYSLLYRSSEQGGVLDYCKENNICFWSYMVLEQGALSGVYNTHHPLPANSLRGEKYNPVLPKLSALTDAMTEIGTKYGINCSQVAIAWALSKGTYPIIGATKAKHVIDAAEARNIQLTTDEMAELEHLADLTGINTRGDWEHSMVNESI